MRSSCLSGSMALTSLVITSTLGKVAIIDDGLINKVCLFFTEVTQNFPFWHKCCFIQVMSLLPCLGSFESKSHSYYSMFYFLHVNATFFFFILEKKKKKKQVYIFFFNLLLQDSLMSLLQTNKEVSLFADLVLFSSHVCQNLLFHWARSIVCSINGVL